VFGRSFKLLELAQVLAAEIEETDAVKK